MMAVFLFYAYRVLKRPMTLLISLLLPIALAGGVFAQYQAATSVSVTVAVPDRTLRSFVVERLHAEHVATDIVSAGDVGTATGVVLAVDSTAKQLLDDPSGVDASVTGASSGAAAALLAVRLNALVSTMQYSAEQSSSLAELRSTLHGVEQAKVPIAVSRTVIGNEDSTVLMSTFNMIVFVMLLLTMTNILMFMRDKANSTTQRILVAARSTLSYHLQIVGVYAAIGVAQLAVMVLAMQYLFHVDLGLEPLRLAVLFVAYALLNVFGICLGMLVVSATTKVSVGRIAVTAIVLPVCMLGGALWPSSIMPDWMQSAAWALPTRWVTGLNEHLFSGFAVAQWDVWRPLLLLISICAVLFAILRRIPADRV